MKNDSCVNVLRNIPMIIYATMQDSLLKFLTVNIYAGFHYMATVTYCNLLKNKTNDYNRAILPKDFILTTQPECGYSYGASTRVGVQQKN